MNFFIHKELEANHTMPFYKNGTVIHVVPLITFHTTCVSIFVAVNTSIIGMENKGTRKPVCVTITLTLGLILLNIMVLMC